MKKPLSIIIKTKDEKLNKEIHIKYDTETSHPRLEILKFLFKYFFKINFGK